MDILLDNLSWMSFNIFLAFLGVSFGFFLLHTKTPYLKILFFALWLLFVPNTIYLLTDIKWFFEQFPKLDILGQTLLFAQYIVIVSLGVATFIFGLYPFEKFLSTSKFQGISPMLFLINYLIAFGVMLGRWQRINSWDVFIRPQAVLESSLNILRSQEYLILVLLFGTLGNIIYFGWKKTFRIKKKT